MKASEVVLELKNLIDKFGDLNVGVMEWEFTVYEPIVDISIKNRKFNNDSFESKFIGID